MAIEDVSLAMALPGFTVVVPADEVEARAATFAIASHVGPVYMRVGRPKAPVVYEQGCEFALGKAIQVRPGQDATVVANGLMVAAALEAADVLAGLGIDVRVLDMATVRPLDEDALLAAASETRGLVVAEEHLRHGGLCSAVAMAVSLLRPTRMHFVAIEDTYAESGRPDELMEKYGLTSRQIAAAVKRILE